MNYAFGFDGNLAFLAEHERREEVTLDDLNEQEMSDPWNCDGKRCFECGEIIEGPGMMKEIGHNVVYLHDDCYEEIV